MLSGVFRDVERSGLCRSRREFFDEYLVTKGFDSAGNNSLKFFRPPCTVRLVSSFLIFYIFLHNAIVILFENLDDRGFHRFV